MSLFKCCKPNCNSTEYRVLTSGNNTGLYCAKCHKWQKWLNKTEVKLFKEELNKVLKKTNYERLISMSIEEMAEDRVKINALTFGSVTWAGDFGHALTKEEAIKKEIEWLNSEI